jgi:hypothetical protein
MKYLRFFELLMRELLEANPNQFILHNSRILGNQ